MTEKDVTKQTVPNQGSKTENDRQSRFKTLITVWGFAILLILPTLDQWLGLSSGFVSTEKRTLTPFPTFQFPHVQTFIAKFNQYYKENFGWRNALFYQYSQWKYYVLNTSPLPEKVVVGKNGWFYPGNSMNQILDRHQGLAINPDTMAAVAQRLTTYQQQLAAQGTKLYLLIAPDSYTIYPENLPNYLQTVDSQANFNRIKNYLLQHTTVPVVDVRNTLTTAKSDRIVYCQTDTHWNFYGSLLATLTLVDRVRQDFPQIPKPRLADYQVQALKGEGGDLTMMLAMNDKLVDSVQYKITLPAHLRIRQTEATKNSDMDLPSERFVSTSTNLPKLLLLGDSFSYWMNQFVPGYFRESYLVRTHKLDMQLARAERPDIVVIEIVERNIDFVGRAQ
ncbi:alginate O-acetyltransferase AlgX-related protein [Spirosoma sp.]|uniref:alginate O-acetyltransferase AlgX-related protein n=1 Tax=Spirosoma sp. TaxID=1899569 RepID=UPI003B3B892F